MPSDIFSAYPRSSQWMKLAEKNKNLRVETYTHAQSYSTNYKNGAQNIKAKESYGYDIRGPSGRVKEKKSAGFDGTRAANGKIEGEAWRHKTDGFSDETFNNGFNVGKRLENPFGSPRRIDNAFPSSPLRPRALDNGPPSWALERGLGSRALQRAKPLVDDNRSFRDGFRTALFGTNYANYASSTVSTATTSGSESARPLGVDQLREESPPVSYANFTPSREDSLPPSSGPNRPYPSRGIAKNKSRLSTKSNSTLAPKDSASQRSRFS
ncbi:hypothetical protein BJX68DRAFT_269282 [Aspergillus pseudodeflectus]|uniref:Uncharacterized protein n=1 Tax=Aspergillus pseudodeflectus TaxID=176178 RepID=A0ABR4JZ67_9EURO